MTILCSSLSYTEIVDKNNVVHDTTQKEFNIKTRGPRGPWVAHLRKRSKVTVEPFTEDHLCCPPNIGRGPLDDVIPQI